MLSLEMRRKFTTESDTTLNINDEVATRSLQSGANITCPSLTWSNVL
jgi:hypothetical protein